jgi:hypothetical protein
MIVEITKAADLLRADGSMARNPMFYGRMSLVLILMFSSPPFFIFKLVAP